MKELDMTGNMDDETRSHMREAVARMWNRPNGPDVWSMAPDFDLPVLGGNGERASLADPQGKPVGLIFASLHLTTLSTAGGVPGGNLRPLQG